MKNPSKLAAEFRAYGRSRSCPVIDTHAHGGPFAGIWFPHVNPEDMVRSMERCGVRLTFLASHPGLFDAAVGNAYTARMVRQHPNHFRGYWAVNPNYPDRVAAEAPRLQEHPEFVGFKFLADYHKYPIDGPHYAPALEHANSRGLPVLLHTWGGSSYDGPANVRAVAQRYPNARLLLGHSISGQWDEAIGLAAEFPHVYLEVTGVTHHPGLFEKMVAGVGSEKILFGTDAPWFDPHYGIGCVLWSHISDEDRHNILHRNAERLFHITPL